MEEEREGRTEKVTRRNSERFNRWKEAEKGQKRKSGRNNE